MNASSSSKHDNNFIQARLINDFRHGKLLNANQPIKFGLMHGEKKTSRKLIWVTISSLNAQIRVSKKNTQLFKFKFKFKNSGELRLNP